jgi:FlaA1/EpsC-like NDP-sugar epimerase
MATRSSYRRLTHLPTAVLICLEAVIFLLAPVLGVVISAATLSTEALAVAAVAYAVASLVSMAAFRLYAARRSSFPGLVLRVGLASTLSALISSLLYALVPKLADVVSILAAATMFTFVATLAIRIAVDCIWDRDERRVVLVLGSGGCAAELARLRRSADRQRFVVLRVDVREDVLAYCQENGVEEIVVATDDQRHRVKVCRASAMRPVQATGRVEARAHSSG